MLDMSTVQIIGSSRMQVKTLDEIFDKLTPFVKDMTTALNKARVFKVGDKGPGGGIVFFVQGDVRKEVSPFLGVFYYGDADKTATNYKGGGYTDWHLPSRVELKQIYENLQKSGVANLLTGEKDDRYWSSTYEGDYGYSNVPHNSTLGFRNGREDHDYIGSFSYTNCVRAVRQF
jgi:hypothetical protein